MCIRKSMHQSNRECQLSDADREYLWIIEYRTQGERAQRLEDQLRKTVGPLLDEYLNAVQRRENAVRAMTRVL